jgi:hypothetical protein
MIMLIYIATLRLSPMLATVVLPLYKYSVSTKNMDVNIQLLGCCLGKTPNLYVDHKLLNRRGLLCFCQHTVLLRICSASLEVKKQGIKIS